MTAPAWKELIVYAVEQQAYGNPEQLDLLARVLAELDLAKQALRHKGYGCLGMDLLETVNEIPARD